MLDSIRNAAKTWVAKLLIGLLAVSFAVWGIADVFTGSTRGALATVGKAEVSAESFSQAFNQYMQNFTRQTGQPMTPEDARKLGIDRAILNNLIQSAAIDDQALDLGLHVSDAQIARETAENPAFLDSAGKFDPDRFRRLLTSNGLNEAMYLAGERQDRLRDAITTAADGDMPVANALLAALHRHRNEQRDARYFVISVAATDVSAPSDDDSRKEYDANPAAYTAPEYRVIAMMKAEPADLAARIALSDEDMAAGYEKYRNDYFTPEKRTVLQLSLPSLEEAQKARQRIMAGEDFAAVARELGFTESDITFADKTKADFFDTAIAEAAFSLAEGLVSEPVKGTLATVLLKVTKVTPEHQPSVDEIRAALGERLKLERAREEIQSIYDAVEDARAAQTKFEDIAGKAGIPFLLVGPIDAAGLARTGEALDIPQKAEVLRAGFNSDVGVENDAISLDDGYIWYEVREVIPSSVKPFDEVKEQARAAVAAARLRDLVNSKAAALVDKARAGTALDALAAESGAEIRTATGLKRNESSIDFSPAAVRAVFGVPENGFAFALEPDGKSARIIQSQAVLLPPFEPAAAEASALRSEVSASAASDVLSSYLGALEKHVGVSVNETLWRQISGTATQ